MVIKLLYKFQIDRKRNEFARVSTSNCFGRTNGLSEATPRPALAYGNAGKNYNTNINITVSKTQFKHNGVCKNNAIITL